MGGHYLAVIIHSPLIFYRRSEESSGQMDFYVLYYLRNGEMAPSQIEWVTVLC